MGRKPCCVKEGLKKGAWSAQEDLTLVQYVNTHGEGKWRDLPARAGLKRCGKSCRLRWLNYLNPNIKRGNISPDEEDLIVRFHKLLGNRWSLIAGRLPGRTDNEIKNYWNTNLSKKVKYPPKRQSNSAKDHESTRAAAVDRPHQVIRPKALRCYQMYPLPFGHEDTEAKEQTSLPTAPNTRSMATSMLLRETDLSKCFMDFSDQNLLPAGGVEQDLFTQTWNFDMAYASDIYEGNATNQIRPNQSDEWDETFVFRPSF